jgi:hypothetical protein
LNEHDYIVNDLEKRIRYNHPTDFLGVETEYVLNKPHWAGEYDMIWIHEKPNGTTTAYMFEVKGTYDDNRGRSKARQQLSKDKRLIEENPDTFGSIDDYVQFFVHYDPKMAHSYHPEIIKNIPEVEDYIHKRGKPYVHMTPKQKKRNKRKARRC